MLPTHHASNARSFVYIKVNTRIRKRCVPSKDYFATHTLRNGYDDPRSMFCCIDQWFSTCARTRSELFIKFFIRPPLPLRYTSAPLIFSTAMQLKETTLLLIYFLSILLPNNINSSSLQVHFISKQKTIFLSYIIFSYEFIRFLDVIKTKTCRPSWSYCCFTCNKS